MRATLPWLATCLLLPAVLLAACGDSGRSVTGVIIDVQADSLTEVDTFTVRDDEGERFVFHVAPDAARDPAEGFNPTHLRSHALVAERVKISYREEGQELLALKLDHP